MTVKKILFMMCVGTLVFLTGCSLLFNDDDNDDNDDDETIIHHDLPRYPQNGEYVFSYSLHEYYFSLKVNAGETYIIGWQDRYDKSPEASWTAGLVITASHEDGSLIFEDAHDGYSNPRSFTPGVNETITIKAHDYNYTGTATIYYIPASSVPSNLGISSVSANSISLTWTGASDASGYRVYRSLERTTDFTLADTVTGTSFTDNTVINGTGYYYRVVPLVSGKEGLSSGTVFSFAAAFWNLPLHTAKQALNMTGAKHYYRLAVTAGTSYTIEWQTGWYNDGSTVTSASGAATSVYVSAWQNDGTTVFTSQYNGFTSPKTFTAASSGYVTVEVKQHGSYTGTYAVYYFDNGAVNTGDGSGALPPAAPGNLRVLSPTSSAINLSWNSVSGASLYRVFRANSGNGAYSLIGTTNGGTSYTDTSVTGGMSYYYKVSAVSSGGESPQSGAAYGFAANYYELSYHTGKQVMNMTSGSKHYYRLAVSSGTSYTIEWQTGWYNDGSTVTSASGAATSVYVSAWQNDGTTVFTDQYNGFTSPKTFTAASSGYVTVEVKQHGSYTGTYAVYYFDNGAVNTGDGSGALPPAAPGNLRVLSPTSSAINLSWNSVSGASLYRVFRANASNASYSLVGTTGGTSYTDTSVTGGMFYYYKVSAVGSGGESPQSGAAYGFAANYYELSYHTGKQVMNMTSGSKHYYRLAVTAGTSYTIEWQTGWYNDGSTVTSASGAATSVYVSAWQNDGTTVFTDQYNGFTSPKTFTAASSGYVTVEVKQDGSNTGNYAVYYYQN